MPVHYENMPMQYTDIFKVIKNENFQCKPHFFYIRVGFQGLYFSRTCFPDFRVIKNQKLQNVKHSVTCYVNLTSTISCSGFSDSNMTFIFPPLLHINMDGHLPDMTLKEDNSTFQITIYTCTKEETAEQGDIVMKWETPFILLPGHVSTVNMVRHQENMSVQ